MASRARNNEGDSGRRAVINLYAAILSKHRVSFEEVKTKIDKMGFKVVGRDLEELEDIPQHIVLWMLFGIRGLYPDMPIQGYVRVASTEHVYGRSYVRTFGVPWYMKIYYKILFEGLFLLERLKR